MEIVPIAIVQIAIHILKVATALWKGRKFKENGQDLAPKMLMKWNRLYKGGDKTNKTKTIFYLLSPPKQIKAKGISTKYR